MIIRNETVRLQATVWGAGRSVWEPDGITPEVEFLGVRFGEAPAEVRAALGIMACCIRSRRYLVDGAVVLESDSYIVGDLAVGNRISEEDTGPGGTYARLAELGRAPVRFREDVTVDGGSLVTTRTAYDAEDRPVEYSRIRHDPSRITLRFEFSA